MKRVLLVYLACILFLPITISAKSVPDFQKGPQFVARDHPSDNGTAVDLFWVPIYGIIEDNQLQLPPGSSFRTLTIEKQDSSGVWQKLDISIENLIEGTYTDSDDIVPDIQIAYRMRRIEESLQNELIEQIHYASVTPTAQWFNHRKLPLLIMLLMLSIAVIYYIIAAKRGKDLFIRKINGLESMDEAVGRATEKGKPILFVPGIGDLDDIQTIAALTILSQLAYKAATYNAELIVPVSKSMVLSTAREVVKEAYMKAGRHDAFKKDNIFYLTDDQFGYVAGIDGIMLREQPAANFFLGTFYAESLILAETGFGTGAMQTAGTAQPHQLPFFVVSCDYTLIGEELFAASAYLSKEPNQLGSLKGQDFGKLVIVLMIIIGSILEMAGYHWFKNFLMMD